MDIYIKGLPDELRNQVRDAGLFQYAYGFYIAYFLILLLGLALGYTLLFYVDSILEAVGVGFLLALFMGQTGFLAHDITHKQVFRSERLRIIAGEFFWGLILGLSMRFWEDDHNQHHQETNKIGQDTQINDQFVFSAQQVSHLGALFRTYVLPIQHYLFFPFTALMYLALCIMSVHYVWSNLPKRRFLAEAALMSVHYLLFVGGMVFVAGWLYTLIVQSIVIFFGGLSMGLAFAPNHKGERILDTEEEVDYLTQIECTRNIKPSLFVDIMLGGLNYQIEHHLFPKMPRPFLKRARPIVQAFCKEKGIVYHETSLVGSYIEILRSLKENSQTSRTEN